MGFNSGFKGLKVICTPLEKVHQKISERQVVVNIWSKKVRGNNRAYRDLNNGVFKNVVYHQT